MRASVFEFPNLARKDSHSSTRCCFNPSSDPQETSRSLGADPIFLNLCDSDLSFSRLLPLFPQERLFFCTDHLKLFATLIKDAVSIPKLIEATVTL